jgi:hypothetical protein
MRKNGTGMPENFLGIAPRKIPTHKQLPHGKLRYFGIGCAKNRQGIAMRLKNPVEMHL